MLTPQPNINLTLDQRLQPSKTYAIDFENGRIIGTVDNLDAIHQYIKKVFKAERYRYLIYDSQYGIEFEKFYDSSYTNELLETELKNSIIDALNDKRILSLDDFKFTFNSDNTVISFTAYTIYGDISYMEVIKRV